MRALQDAMIRAFQAEIARLRAQLAPAGVVAGSSPRHAFGNGAPGVAAAAHVLAGPAKAAEGVEQPLAPERASFEQGAQAWASPPALVRCRWASQLPAYACGDHYEAWARLAGQQ